MKRRTKAALVGASIVVILAFVFFVPVIYIPRYPGGSGVNNGPPISGWVSVSHYYLGAGGVMLHNDFSPSNPYDYSVDW
jgi:uncharacterized RDD family membrane protein YckC